MIIESNNQVQTREVKSLLRSKEVAEILSISRSMAYQLMRQGQIPSVRFGKSIRVSHNDLLKFIEDNKLTRTLS